MGSTVFPRPSASAAVPILRQTITSSSESISIPANVSTVYAYVVGGGGGGGSSSFGGAAGQAFGVVLPSNSAIVGTGGNANANGNPSRYGGLAASGGGAGSGSTGGRSGLPGGGTSSEQGVSNPGSSGSGTFNVALTSDYSSNYGVGGAANSAGAQGVIYLYY